MIIELQELLNQAGFLSSIGLKLEKGKWEYNTKTAWKDALLKLAGTQYSNKILNHLIESKPTNIDWFKPTLDRYILTLNQKVTDTEEPILEQTIVIAHEDKPKQEPPKYEVKHPTIAKPTSKRKSTSRTRKTN